MEMMLFSLKNS